MKTIQVAFPNPPADVGIGTQCTQAAARHVQENKIKHLPKGGMHSKIGMDEVQIRNLMELGPVAGFLEARETGVTTEQPDSLPHLRSNQKGLPTRGTAKISQHSTIFIFTQIGHLLTARIHAKTPPLQIGRVFGKTRGSNDDAVGQRGMNLVRNLVLFKFPAKGWQVGLENIDPINRRGDFSRYVMPDVMGRNLNQVTLFFESNDFELGNIRYVDLADMSAGLVVKQFPEPGYVLTDEDSINLEVSR